MKDSRSGTGQPAPRFGVVLASILAAVMLLSIGFVAGLGTMWVVGPNVRQALTQRSQSSQSDGDAAVSRQARIDLLWEVWSLLDQEYVSPEKMDDQEMVYGAVAGLVAAVGDPHTAFVEPASASIMDEDMSGSFEGIGATVDMVDGQVIIVAPLEGSPAMQAGIEAGDIILEVDGTSLEGMSLMDAITLIRGPQGTVVRLLVQRENVAEPFLVPVTRDRVELVTVEYEMLEGNVGYLALREFNAVSGDKVQEALKSLRKQGAEAVIFDLRGNPGGYLHMAVEVASEFLPRGTVVLTEEERGQGTQEYRVKRAGEATDLPLVVLVDGGSASASEIVAGAIQDNQRSILIGTRTFGKGSVQNTHTLQDGSSLRVTIAKWLLPGGAHLDGEGILPDIEVPLTDENTADDRDPQLERALEYLQTGG